MGADRRIGQLTGSDVGIASAVIAAAVVGVALVAGTPWGATDSGRAARLWAVPMALAGVQIALGRRARPTRPPEGGRMRAVMGGVCLGGLMAVGNVAAAVGGRLSGPRYPFGQEAVELWPAIVVVGILAPIVEELFFRGALLQYLRATHGAFVAVAVSAAAFALGHGDISAMPQVALGGLVLGVAYVRFGAVVTPILAHAMGNLTAVLLLARGDGTACAVGLSPVALVAAAAACAGGLALAARPAKHPGLPAVPIASRH